MDRRGVDALIVALAESNGMVVTGRQLADAGLTRQVVRTRVGGLLTPVTPGVFVVGRLSPAARLHAALAAVPSGVASHRTAASINRLSLPPADEVDVVAPRSTRRSIDGVRFRFTRWLPDEDVTTIDGIRVTTGARTLCDLAAVVARARLRHLVEEAVAADLVAVAEFQACLVGYCRRGRLGSGIIRSLDHELLDSEPVPASELERRGQRLLRRAGLSGWNPQHRPPWYDGRRGIVDLAWPELGVVVELDGRRWHATTQALSEDRRRDRLAAAHGWLTLRFGWQEIVHRPGLVIEECRSALAARRSSTGSDFGHPAFDNSGPR